MGGFSTGRGLSGGFSTGRFDEEIKPKKKKKKAKKKQPKNNVSKIEELIANAKAEVTGFLSAAKNYSAHLGQVAKEQKKFEKKHKKALTRADIEAQTATSIPDLEIPEWKQGDKFAIGRGMVKAKKKRTPVNDLLDELHGKREKIPQSPASKATEGPAKAYLAIGGLTAGAKLPFPPWIWAALGGADIANKAAHPRETLEALKKLPLEEAASIGLDVATLPLGIRALKGKLSARALANLEEITKSKAKYKRPVSGKGAVRTTATPTPRPVELTDDQKVIESLKGMQANQKGKEPSELWQMTYQEAVRKPGKNKIARAVAHKQDVKAAIREGKYETAIKYGLMDESRAKEIIKSAGYRHKITAHEDVSALGFKEKPIWQMGHPEYVQKYQGKGYDYQDYINQIQEAIKAGAFKRAIDSGELSQAKAYSILKAAKINPQKMNFETPEMIQARSAEEALARNTERANKKTALTKLRQRAKEIESYGKNIRDYPKYLHYQPELQKIKSAIEEHKSILEQLGPKEKVSAVGKALPLKKTPVSVTESPVIPKNVKPALKAMIKRQTPEKQAEIAAIIKNHPTPKKFAKPESAGNLEPVESQGPTRTRGLSAGVEQKAIEHKLTKSLGDLPEYKQVNMKDQAKFSSELLALDPNKAIKIALGRVEPPSHILPESVFTAVENRALEQGDIGLIKQLAHSSRATQATVMGQRIRALAERNPDSAVGAIRQVASKRARAAEKKLGKSVDEALKETAGKIKAEIKKPTRQDWESFIKELRC